MKVMSAGSKPVTLLSWMCQSKAEHPEKLMGEACPQREVGLSRGSRLVYGVDDTCSPCESADVTSTAKLVELQRDGQPSEYYADVQGGRASKSNTTSEVGATQPCESN